MTYFVVGAKGRNFRTREIEATGIKAAADSYAVNNPGFEIVEVKKQGYRKIMEGRKDA